MDQQDFRGNRPRCLGLYAGELRRQDRASIHDFSGTIPKVILKNPNVNIDLSQKSILEFNQYVEQGSGEKSLIKELTLQDMNFNLKANEINMDARISADFNLTDQ